MISHILPDLIKVTENAALACHPQIGKGERKEADRLATESMRTSFQDVSCKGTIVIGEGERDEAPMLYIGEAVGSGNGMEIDIAVDPLEGTNLCAENRAGSITVIGIGPKGSLMHAPDTYMDKIIVGPQVQKTISFENSMQVNLERIAESYDGQIQNLNILVMKRKRNDALIAELRSFGVSVTLIDDGDVFGGLSALFPEKTGIHALMGIGAAPEGVITACAVRAYGGQMQGRFMPYDTDMLSLDKDVVQRMKNMGIDDHTRIFDAKELAQGDDLAFIASGVTQSAFLSGIQIDKNRKSVHSLVIASKPTNVSFISRIYS